MYDATPHLHEGLLGLHVACGPPAAAAMTMIVPVSVVVVASLPAPAAIHSVSVPAPSSAGGVEQLLLGLNACVVQENTPAVKGTCASADERLARQTLVLVLVVVSRLVTAVAAQRFVVGIASIRVIVRATAMHDGLLVSLSPSWYRRVPTPPFPLFFSPRNLTRHFSACSLNMGTESDIQCRPHQIEQRLNGYICMTI